MNEHSVTRWIGEVKQGNEMAAQQLWNRYFQQLVRLCRNKLQSHPRRSEDEEDVAISAFARVLVGLEHDRFPQVTDRDDLWRLLVRIAADKAVDRIRAEGCPKRRPGQGFSRTDQAAGSEDSTPADTLERAVGREPTPEFAAIVVEEYDRLLAQLSSDTLRRVATMKMEGFTAEEIAVRLGTSERSIQRKLSLIRREWS